MEKARAILGVLVFYILLSCMAGFTAAFAEPAPPQTRNLMYGLPVDWNKADKLLRRGEGFRTQDLETGQSWYAVRVGGVNHMEIEPYTLKDTRVLESLYPDGWSWKRRAVLVRIGGTWYAASINGMPQNPDRLENNGFNGHHCLHFQNSRTHITDRIDPQHQAMVMRAAGID